MLRFPITQFYVVLPYSLESKQLFVISTIIVAGSANHKSLQVV